MKLNNIVDHAKFGILTVILCGTTALTQTYVAQKNNDDVIKSVKQEMQFVHKYIENSMIKNLVKQSKKIKKDPSDIKMIDVEQALNDWKEIENKAFYQEDYDVIKNWYDKQIKK